jgi:hypothetical protein
MLRDGTGCRELDCRTELLHLTVLLLEMDCSLLRSPVEIMGIAESLCIQVGTSTLSNCAALVKSGFGPVQFVVGLEAPRLCLSPGARRVAKCRCASVTDRTGGWVTRLFRPRVAPTSFGRASRLHRSKTRYCASRATDRSQRGLAASVASSSGPHRASGDDGTPLSISSNRSSVWSVRAHRSPNVMQKIRGTRRGEQDLVEFEMGMLSDRVAEDPKDELSACDVCEANRQVRAPSAP